MSKKVSKKEDTISQLKKEEEKRKKQTKKEEEEENSEDEEELNDNAIKEQTVQKADKPKNIKELMSSLADNKPKSKKTTNANKAQKKKYDEPAKLKFVNTKGTGNADKIDNELRNKMNLDKKVYKNAKGLDNAAKDNEKIKPTKNYLEKDIEKQYKDDNEEVAKPQFTSNKEDGENFVELNKNEDVRNILFIII